MAFRIVTNSKTIEHARKQVIAAFRQHGARLASTVIGYPGGNQPSRVYWAKDLGIWLATDVIAKSRYWNAFGTWDPNENKMVPICCEINLPLFGINRRISGAIAENERGQLFLVHRGQIGGGRRGVGAELFWKHFDGEPTNISDGDREAKMVVVGSVGSPRLLPQIQFFVRDIERIKRLANPSPDRDRPENVGADSVEIKDIGDEFEGSRTYIVSRRIDAACEHGIVVNRLRPLLQKRGYSIGNDRFRDLYVHRNGRITAVFEVKPDISTTSIYCAVGQLLIHGLIAGCHPKLFFVVPEELSMATREKLMRIGIDVIGYRLVHGEPEFPRLNYHRF